MDKKLQFKNKNYQNEQKIMELLEENENIIIKTTEDVASKTPRPNLRPVNFFHSNYIYWEMKKDIAIL